MTAPHADQLIDGYLARIRAAAGDLPAGACDELLDDMRSHIAEARAHDQEETDATILNILDRLGDPGVVVVDARERLGIRPAAASGPGILEIAALVLLPFIWIIGVILLWVSPAWKTRDKLIGSIFSLGGYPGIAVLGASVVGHHAFVVRSGSPCMSVDSAGNCLAPTVWDQIGSIFSVIFVVVVFLLPVITSVYLAIRLRWGRPRQATAMA